MPKRCEINVDTRLGEKIEEGRAHYLDYDVMECIYVVKMANIEGRCC
jgi:hypothetical protein